MDQSEESLQQLYIVGGAGQMANTQSPLHDTPDAVATSSNVCVPVSSIMQPPPPPPLVYQEAQAQHLEHVRERLRLFWANQMQEMKSEDLKNHSLPLTPIKRIMKADKDVRMIAKESAAVFGKACEMFILDITSRAWINTEEDGRRTVQNKDIASAICKTDIYDFLEEVIPRNELREQILKATNARQHVDSPTVSIIPRYNVPQQHGVGVSSSTSAGCQQPPPFMPLYRPGPQNQQYFMLGPQAQSQQNQQQPPMSWPQAEQQLDQQTPEQPSLSSPQAEQTLDRQQNDN